MSAFVVQSVGMPKRKPDFPKEAISLTLSRANLKAVREIVDAMEFPASVSQIVDRAITDFLANRSAKQTHSRTRRPST